MKLFLAAPLSGLPSDPIALGSQASRLHFVMKLALAAPASGLPSFDTALLSHVPGAGVPCAAAELIADAISKIASINRVIVFSIVGNEKRALLITNRPYRTGTNGTSAFGAGLTPGPWARRESRKGFRKNAPLGGGAEKQGSRCRARHRLILICRQECPT